MLKVFYNGHIHTPFGRPVSAMAIRGNRVLALGEDRALLQMVGAERGVAQNLEGAYVVPGFNDSHCHLLEGGVRLGQIDLTGVSCAEEILSRARAYLRENPPAPGEWIVGFGFDQNGWKNPQMPTRELADAISREHPVVLCRVCGHAGVANSRALQKTGLDQPREIEGGEIVLGEDGRPNGVLHEKAYYLLTREIPQPRGEAVDRALRAAMRKANRLGITSAQSDDLGNAPLEELLGAIGRMRERGEMTVRIFEEALVGSMGELENLFASGMRTGLGDDWFRMGNVKLLTDGSLGAQSAYMRAPYRTGGRGVLAIGREELNAIARCAKAHSTQLAFHAIGDGALEACIDAVEAARRPGDKNMRNRIVHCQFADDALIDRMRLSGLCADIQPAFVGSDWPLVEKLLGPERMEMGYRWRSLLEKGIPVAAGSDSPIDEQSPLWGMTCAVARQDKAGLPQGGFLPSEKLSRRQALELYTSAGAFLSFDEGRKGMLAPGMLADFAVLSGDVLSAPIVELPEISVLATFVDGKICFDRDGRFSNG